MSDLSSSTIWGNLTVTRDAQIKGEARVQKDIYEKGQSLEQKYGSKEKLDALQSLADSIAEATGGLDELAFLKLNNNATYYADGSGKWSIPPNNKYTPGTGLALVNGKFNHSNSIAAGTVKEGGNTRVLGFNNTFKIPSFTYDSEGHITGSSSITLTMPSNPNTTYKADNSKGIYLDTSTNTFSLDSVFRGEFEQVQALANSMSETVGNLGPVEPYPDVNSKYLDGTGAWSVPNDTKYVPGTGLSLEGNKFFVKDEYVKKVGDSMSGDLIMGNKDIINIRSLGLGTSTPNFGIDTVEDIRIRDDSSLKMGGVGAADVEFELEYDKESKSVNFNFFV